MPLRRRLVAFAAAVCAFALVSRAQTPSLVDPNLTVQRVVGNLELPTGIAFLPKSNNAFILEKDTGKVKILQGDRVRGTAIDLNVNGDSERGLLGIALHPRFTRNGLVYLYHTNADSNGNATDNRISAFKYNAETRKLTLERVIKRLPVQPGPNHDGGKIVFGPDQKLYAVIGDLNRRERTSNNEDSNTIGRNTVVLRLNPKNGSAPTDNPFFSAKNTGARKALNDIYAYGVRNSFGMNFDPATGHLWDTENGQNDYDEINRVRPGMNNGWTDIMGPRSRAGSGVNLVNLAKGARYRDPLFSWEETIGVTDLNFPMRSIGSSYRDSIIVGDNNTGQLYRFRLNADRSNLDLANLGAGLLDRVLDSGDNGSPLLFGENFGVVTDIERGPGGLYLTAFDFSGNGSVYRISRASGATASLHAASVPEPGSIGVLALAATSLLRRRRR